MSLNFYYCPRRVLAQTAKSRGGILEVPRIREENFAVPEKISIFQEQGSQGIAETSLGVEETLEGVWERSLCMRF